MNRQVARLHVVMHESNYDDMTRTGTSTFTDYTALGDAVNAAFRMESSTKELGTDVVIGSRTHEAMQALPSPERFFQPHEVALKGYDTPTAVWSASLEGLRTLVKELPATA